jgi:hypothetical protein
MGGAGTALVLPQRLFRPRADFPAKPQKSTFFEMICLSSTQYQAFYVCLLTFFASEWRKKRQLPAFGRRMGNPGKQHGKADWNE